MYVQVLEGDFYQYLLERPMGDGIFYSYRWFLVNFKRGKSEQQACCFATTFAANKPYGMSSSSSVLVHRKARLLSRQHIVEIISSASHPIHAFVL